jgi:hypothetical protein
VNGNVNFAIRRMRIEIPNRDRAASPCGALGCDD